MGPMRSNMFLKAALAQGEFKNVNPWKISHHIHSLFFVPMVNYF